MKKITILIFSILLTNTVFATDSLVFKLRKRDYKHVDSISQTYKTVDEAISKIALFKEDVDKARAVYNFVASYMTYEDFGLYLDLEESLQKAIKTKKGKCYNFSLLYDYVCKKIGLGCVVITGPTKSNINFTTHAWNVVTIDSIMYILDVTYADASDTPLLPEKDRKKVDYNHFLIPPEYAITYYFPEIVLCDDIKMTVINNNKTVILNDIVNFDKSYIERKKDNDIYFSFAAKYQCLDKPRSIYYFIHTPVISDEYEYKIPINHTSFHLRRMPNNDPNLYIKYFYYDIEPATNLYDEKYGNGFRYQYIK